MTKRNGTRGVTLIETILYIALFSILIGGAFVSAYNIFESSDNNQTEAMVLEEGNFILGKINWSLAEKEQVDIPTENSTSTSLSVTTSNQTLSPIVIQMSGKNLTMSLHSEPAEILTNSNIVVRSLRFTRSGTDESDSLTVDFTLTANTPEGHSVSSAFSEHFSYTP